MPKEVKSQYDKVVWLQITSWVGSSVSWAEHYYGRLVVDYRLKKEDIEITAPLTRDTAKKLNKDGDNFHKYKAGEMSGRFWSEDALVQRAVATWREHYPNADILLKGNSAVAQSQLVLDGPEPLKTQLNEIYNECERLGFWEARGQDLKQVEQLQKQWQKLWAPYYNYR